MPEDLPPKKKPGSSKKKKVAQPLSLSGEDIKMPQHLENVIKDAFLRFNNFPDIKKYKLKDLQHLDNIVQEYLKAFVILGYDLNGEKVLVFHASNPHDKDALVEHLRTTLISVINGDN